MNTKYTTSPILRITSLGAFAVLLAACSPSENTSGSSSDTSDSIVTALILKDAPSGALSVSDAFKQAKPGTAIHVTGQIGGAQKPFIDSYAGFVLADPKIDFCDEMGDDHCSTPWDACCEDPDKLKSMRISVQLVDANGAPIQADLKQSIGIKELDQVTVVGTVAEASTATNVIINATGLYRNL